MTTTEETCSPCALRGVAPVMVCEPWTDGWRDMSVAALTGGGRACSRLEPGAALMLDERVCLPHMPSGGVVSGEGRFVVTPSGLRWWLQ